MNKIQAQEAIFDVVTLKYVRRLAVHVKFTYV